MQGEILKAGATDVMFKPFDPQGEAGSSEFPPVCVSSCQGWGLWCCHITAPSVCFNMSILSFVQCVQVTQLVSGFHSQGVVLYVATDSVCLWWGMNLGVSQFSIMNLVASQS